MLFNIWNQNVPEQSHCLFFPTEVIVNHLKIHIFLKNVNMGHFTKLNSLIWASQNAFKTAVVKHICSFHSFSYYYKPFLTCTCWQATPFPSLIGALPIKRLCTYSYPQPQVKQPIYNQLSGYWNFYIKIATPSFRVGLTSLQLGSYRAYSVVRRKIAYNGVRLCRGTWGVSRGVCLFTSWDNVLLCIKVGAAHLHNHEKSSTHRKPAVSMQYHMRNTLQTCLYISTFGMTQSACRVFLKVYNTANPSVISSEIFGSSARWVARH